MSAGSNYIGAISVGGLAMLAGDVIKVTAAGKWTNTSGTTGNTQIRLYWNPGTNQLADLNGPISDTGNNVQLTTGQSNIEWWYFALITVRSSGTGGTAWCDSFIENVTNPTSFNQMAGVGAFVAVHGRIPTTARTGGVRE